MNWRVFLLASLPAPILGILCGVYIGDLQIRWFHLGGASGSQAYRPIAWALYGAILGLVVGLITARNFAPQDTAAGFRSAAISTGAVLAFALLALGVSRYFAHISPTMDGQALTLQIEVRLPAGQAKPVAPTKQPNESYATITSYIYLNSVSTLGRDLGVYGNFDLPATREEQGRWIVPGHAPMETSRGQRALDFFIKGSSCRTDSSRRCRPTQAPNRCNGAAGCRNATTQVSLGPSASRPIASVYRKLNRPNPSCRCRWTKNPFSRAKRRS